MSTSAFDEIDEYKCESCGQVPICLNSTGSGHKVCDDCLPLFNPDKSIVCPLPACKIPSHMANKIRLLEEGIKINKSSHEKSLKEVLGHIDSINDNFSNLSLNTIGIETKLKDVETEVNKGVQEMKNEVSKKSKTRDDLRTKVNNLTDKVSFVEKNSRELDQKMKDRSEDYKAFEINNEGISDLKKDLKKVKNELKDFRSSVKLSTNKTNEKMFLMDHSLPQPYLLPMNRFNLHTRNDQFQPVFSWKIKGIMEKMDRKTYEEWSDSFRWTGYPVKAKAKLELKEDDGVYLSMCLEDDTCEATNEKDLIEPYVYYLLRSQGPKNTPSHVTKGRSYLLPAKFHLNLDFILAFVDKSYLVFNEYNVDDSVTIEIYVEPQSMAREAHSHDGTLSWVVKECTKRRLMEKEELISVQDSPYFYTGPKGYKIQIFLGLNGFGEYKGKGPTAYVRFLNVKYDHDLPGSFPHRTTVTLSHPKDPKRRVVKTIDKDINEKRWYTVDLCEVKKLADLIQNDTLYVRVDIVEAIQ